MVFYVCNKCKKYYKTQDNKKYFETCSCGEPFEVYSHLTNNSLKDLEEYEEEPPQQIIDFYIKDYESIVAKIILYTIFVIPNKLGKNKIIDIIKGSKSNYVIENNYQKLRSYSLLADFSKRRLNDVLDILLEKKLISISLNNSYFGGPVLIITKRGKEFLFEDNKICFGFISSLKATILSKNKRQSIHPLTRNIEENVVLSAEDEKLLDELKDRRRYLSQKEGLPAYVISNNKTLIDLAIKKPETKEEMLKIRGIGPKISEKYGDIFLKIIKKHKDNSMSSDNNKKETYK